jgi:superfamily II DNA or RNA helicase
VVVLRGGQSEKQRRDIAARLATIPQAEERVIVATGRYLGEGFDDSRLDTLFLTMPIAWKGTLAQYAGRLHRLNDAKRDVIIYDYADMRVPILARMAAKRRAGYQAIGYRYWVRAICFPAKWSHRTNPRKLRNNQAIK